MARTKVDQLETKHANAAASASYAGAFIKALGDPRQWQYTGDCADGGYEGAFTCLCGHDIRYAFYIKNPKTGEEQIVGSTCILHFQAISPELYASLTVAKKKLEADLRAAKRRAEEAQAKAALGGDLIEYTLKRLALFELVTRVWLYNCDNDFKNALFETPAKPPRFGKAAPYREWMEANLPVIRGLWEQVNSGAVVYLAPQRRYTVRLTDGHSDGKEVGADTIDRLVWEVEVHALAAVTEAVRERHARWYSWKPSTHIKIYIEQGICTPLRGEDWFMMLRPIN